MGHNDRLYRRANKYLANYLTTPGKSIDDIVSNDENLTFNGYKTFRKENKWLKKLKVKGLIEGNIDESEALKQTQFILGIFENHFQPEWMSKTQCFQTKAVVIPFQKKFIIVNYHDESVKNCAFIGYFQLGQNSDYYS